MHLKWDVTFECMQHLRTCENATRHLWSGSHLEPQLLGFGLQQGLHSVHLAWLASVWQDCVHVDIRHYHLQHRAESSAAQIMIDHTILTLYGLTRHCIEGTSTPTHHMC